MQIIKQRFVQEYQITIVCIVLLSILTTPSQSQSNPELLFMTGSVAEEVKKKKLENRRRSNWRLGKIHPSLTQRQSTVGETEVIIKLKKLRDYSTIRHILKENRHNTRSLEREIRDTLRPRSDTKEYRTTREEKEYLSRNVLPSDKTQVLKQTHNKIDRFNNAARKKVYQHLKSSETREQAKLSRLIKQLGGKITTTSTLGNSFSVSLAEADNDFLDMVAASPIVDSITPDQILQLDLDDSAYSVKAPVWWEAGIDGGTFDAGIIDSGIREDHLFLKYRNPLSAPPSQPREIFKQTTGYAGSHGTRTAGIIASSHNQFSGVAFGLDALFDAGGHTYMPESEIMANLDWMINLAHIEETPEVINLSFSHYHGLNEYGPLAQLLDSIVNDLGISITKSAGNQGVTQLGYPQSYNLISVANLDINENQDPLDDYIYFTSSRGPTESGRRKPDITAPGHNTMTTDPASSTSFANHSGTSAAAPHVAGALLLMAHSGVLDPKAQKAILINTAQTWSDNSSFEYSGDDGPAPSATHWDPTYGWGILDLEHALYHLDDWHPSSVTAKNPDSTNDDYRLFSGRMSAEDKATLVWHMRPCSSEEQPQLTNLDLWLYEERSGELLAKDLSVDDNVHQVSTPVERDVIIKVSSSSPVIQDGLKEEFVLATEEGFISISPPSFDFRYTYPKHLKFNKTLSLSVEVFNGGQVPAHQNTTTIETLPGLISEGGNVRYISSIPPETSVRVNFAFTATDMEPGTYRLPMVFTSNSYGEYYTYSDRQAITIKVKKQHKQRKKGKVRKLPKTH